MFTTVSQEPATDPYSEPDEPSPHPHTNYIFKICFNIVLPSTCALTYGMVSSLQNFLQNFYSFNLSQACVMPSQLTDLITPLIFGEE
jgi:hypothetical protein